MPYVASYDGQPLSKTLGQAGFSPFSEVIQRAIPASYLFPFLSDCGVFPSLISLLEFHQIWSPRMEGIVECQQKRTFCPHGREMYAVVLRVHVYCMASARKHS